MLKDKLTLFCGLIGCAILSAACASDAPPPLLPQELGRIWDVERVSPELVTQLTHEDTVKRLTDIRNATPDLFSLEEIGQSVEGRSISHFWFGDGPFHVLLWSQMHGDEATATAALFDVFEHVRRHRTDPAIARILSALTIHTVPMLNPDGAQRFRRRNAQEIDVNRDALLLQTPEGRALKALRDRLNPPLGFNLHNQNWQTSVGGPPRPASLSLLAVAFDEGRHDNPGRIRAKKVAAIIRDAVEPLAAGRIGRYDDEFEVRAFGDNLTKWGTSVVLIETGPWPSDPPDAPLIRLNFVALMTAFDALATGRVDSANPSRYESLPRNESRLFYQMIRNASIVTGVPGVAPFTGDIGIVAARVGREEGGRRQVLRRARIEDVGDLRVFGALETIDATGLTVTPAFAPIDGVGQVISLPDWSRLPAESPRIVTGDPAALMLLASTGDGRYRVIRVFAPETVLGTPD